ncbi:uncharacterized protein LOC110117219 [Athalia rosae]|uniref:uncharacterized protein LOC110117219 n=1 Tax=Athalia rosae TaxID=37344 RepID=UPI0020338106|nr:uncharacterized protein LOC110117219 [Athalia rosae]
MHMQLLKLLCLSVSMICERVTSLSSGSFLKNNTSGNNEGSKWNVLEEFFADFNEAYLKKYEPRQITITSVPTNGEIQRAFDLFYRNWPYIVCPDTENCKYPRNIFNNGNFVIIFLRNLTEEIFMENAKIISLCKECRVLFLSDGIIQRDDVRMIFELAVQANISSSELAHLTEDGVGLYSEMLGDECTMEAYLIDFWKPGVSSERINRWAFKYHDCKGCPYVVSSMTFKPKMIMAGYKNGTRSIVGGLEGKLLLEAAKQMNFTIVMRHPSIVDRMKYSRKSSILKDVTIENAEIGIGRLLQTNYMRDLVEFSVPYDVECVTWGVPRIMSWSSDIVFVEFSKLVWAAVMVMFVVICIVAYVHRQSILPKLADTDKKTGAIIVICDIFTLHLGNSVLWVTSSQGSKYFLLSLLYYATVITTAYKTSLASILATDKGTSAIVDGEGIIKANLSVGGTFFDWWILRDQVNDSKVNRKLLNRFIVNNDDDELKVRLKTEGNFAFLASRSWLSYERETSVRAHEPVTFDIFDVCVMAYPTVVSFQKRSLLRKPMNRIIQRLTESGIFIHWDLENELGSKLVSASEKDQDLLGDHSAHKFRNLFIVYSICIFFCLLAFAVELFVARVQAKKRQEAARNRINYDIQLKNKMKIK